MSSSNLASRRITVRSRSAATSRDDASSKPSSVGNPSSSTAQVAGGGGVAALRKRSALGDMTNAGTRKPLSATGAATSLTSEGGGKDVDGASSHGAAGAKGKLALRDSNGTAAFARGKAVTAGGKPASAAAITTRIGKPSSQRTEEAEQQVRVARRAASAIPLRTTKAGSTASTYSRSNSVQSDASRRTASSNKDDQVAVKRVKTDVGERRVATGKDVDSTALTHKKTATNTTAAAAATIASAAPAKTERAKDEGWEDLDGDDLDDPLMVAEYVNEIFEYMRKIEMDYIPSGDYIDKHPEITWEMRGVLVDWLIDMHSKFRLVPETLFLALNIVDRFLSLRTISLNKLQLVGLTAMFIAAKYEEVLCPSVHNFLYLAEGGYTDEEILKAERYMLKIIKFNLSYASPMNFLRRISKADNYDIQTRTVAKFFMEISLVDHRLLEHPPSLIAAAAVWNARLVLERGEWCPTLVHYSSYSQEELLPTAELMIDYCMRPIQHDKFIKKYSAKKFMKAATYVFEWSKKVYGEVGSDAEDEDGLRVDLHSEFGLVRPARRGSSEAASTADLGSGDDIDNDDEEEGVKDVQYGDYGGGEDEDDLHGDQDARPLTDVTNLDAVRAATTGVSRTRH